ncbi:MAG: hypothetical protein AAGF85_19965 [Bacteroidota bacterium]
MHCTLAAPRAGTTLIKASSWLASFRSIKQNPAPQVQRYFTSLPGMVYPFISLLGCSGSQMSASSVLDLGVGLKPLGDERNEGLGACALAQGRP